MLSKQYLAIIPERYKNIKTRAELAAAITRDINAVPSDFEVDQAVKALGLEFAKPSIKPAAETQASGSADSKKST